MNSFTSTGPPMPQTDFSSAGLLNLCELQGISSITSEPFRQHRGPSKRKRPPSDASVLLSTHPLLRISSSSTTLSDAPASSRSIVDDICGRLSSTDQMFSSVNSEFLTACRKEQEDEMNSRRALNILMQPDSDGKKVVCHNCGETDSTKLQEDGDRFGIACQSCGAVVRNAMPVHCKFERVQRFDIPTDNRNANEGGRSLANGVKSSKERSKARMSEIGNSSTSVSYQHKAAQDKIQRRSITKANTEEVGLTKAQDTRRQHVMVEISRMLLGIGRDPDSCPIFDYATRMVNTVFVVAGAHTVVCGQHTHSDACPSSVLSASVTSLACEAVQSTINIFLSEDEDSNSITNSAVDSSSIRRARLKLSAILDNYAALNHISEHLNRKFLRLFNERSSLKSACPVIQKESTSLSIVQVDVAMPSALLASTSNPALSKRVKASIESLASLKWINVKAAHRAIGFCNSAEFTVWEITMGCWSADLLALIISIAAEPDHSEQLTERLYRLGKQEGISTKTIQENMIPTLKNGDTNTGDPWE